jgi:hypothetical protein
VNSCDAKKSAKALLLSPGILCTTVLVSCISVRGKRRAMNHWHALLRAGEGLKREQTYRLTHLTTAASRSRVQLKALGIVGMPPMVRRVDTNEFENLGYEGGAGISARGQACVQQFDAKQNSSSRRPHSPAGVLEERVCFGAHGCSVGIT